MPMSAPLASAGLLALAFGMAACAGSSEVALVPETRQQLDAIPCDSSFELSPTFFAPYSTDLDDDARRGLDKNLYLLARCETATIGIDGYIDGLSEVDSARTSTQRAEAVRRYYVEHGLAPERIAFLVGRGELVIDSGEEHPAVDPRMRLVVSYVCTPYSCKR